MEKKTKKERMADKALDNLKVALISVLEREMSEEARKAMSQEESSRLIFDIINAVTSIHKAEDLAKASQEELETIVTAVYHSLSF